MPTGTVLVSGASSGIGRSATLCLTQEGWHVIGIGRDHGRLQEVAAEAQGDCDIEMCNFDSLESIPELVTTVKKKYGRIDALLNCAGQHILSPLQLTDDDDLVRLITVNTLAPIALLRELLKMQAINDGSAIIYVGSAAARKGTPGAAIYTATKGAIAAFSRSMAIELASRKITVNCIEPGIVDTPLTSAMLARLPQHSRDAITAQHPLGLGDTQSIARLCSYILSTDGRWITGTQIPIDGGFSAA
jgi:NAD(P)-dependent dehydrogenase (short-subunit alcohol dehydrogenase family)